MAPARLRSRSVASIEAAARITITGFFEAPVVVVVMVDDGPPLTFFRCSRLSRGVFVLLGLLSNVRMLDPPSKLSSSSLNEEAAAFFRIVVDVGEDVDPVVNCRWTKSTFFPPGRRAATSKATAERAALSPCITKASDEDRFLLSSRAAGMEMAAVNR